MSNLNGSVVGTKFTVKVVGPLDNFESGTLLLEEWLARNGDERARELEDFLKATVAVSRHPWWEWGLRYEPRVAYNVESDCRFVTVQSPFGTEFGPVKAGVLGETRG